MAEIRQGYLDDYTQITSGNIGIGTSSASDAKLEIVGGTTSQELNVTGIATFGSVSGFIEKHTTYTENVNITNGDSGTLSGEIVVGAGLTMTVGTGATASQGSLHGLKISTMFKPPSGITATRPAGKPGSLFYNFDFKTIEFFDGNSWRQVDNVTRSGRGLFCGGYAPGTVTTIDFIQISTLGNSSRFGDLITKSRITQGFASDVRGIHGGGTGQSTGNSVSNHIEYVTMASSGNSIDFGDLTEEGYARAGASSNTRGLFFAGYNPALSPAHRSLIDYIQINTLGNALDFGDPYLAYDPQGCSSPTRAVFSGGQSPSTNVNTIEFVTIASKGNSQSFGVLVQGVYGAASASNSTRGIVAGGYYGPAGNTAHINSLTIASEGNAVYFGDLSLARRSTSAVSNGNRVCIAGGKGSPSVLNIIDFITISSSGSTQDFGELGLAREQLSGFSDSHGGLGGF